MEAGTYGTWEIVIGYDAKEETYWVDVYGDPKRVSVLWTTTGSGETLPTLERAQAALGQFLWAQCLKGIIPGHMRVRLREEKDGRGGTPLQRGLLAVLDWVYGVTDRWITGTEPFWRQRSPR